MGDPSKDKVRELAEPGRYADGDGLMLQIRPNGGKSWLLRVQINGRWRDVGLGCLEDVPLTTARQIGGYAQARPSRDRSA